jgi:hypothetical protein
VEEVMVGRSRRWDESSTSSKVLVMLLTALQVSLAVSAWADLAERPAEQVNGRKRRWAAIIAINFVGPMLYFTRGRRLPAPRR